MNWLIHNPIADIHGPSFLLFYAVIAAVIVAAAYRIVRPRDRTGLREPPPVPGTFDPYEIAYLRGGKDAIIDTVLYALHRRGLLTVIPQKWFQPGRIVATDDMHGAGALTGLEERILRSAVRPVAPSSLYQRGTLARDVDRLCEPYRNRLESEELLRPADPGGTAKQVALAASAVLVSLSAYKILIAIPEGRPFGFLVFLTFLSLVLLWATVWSAAAARISDRGKAYLKRLELAYGDVRQPEARRNGAQPEPSDMPSIALVGLLGVGILSGTPDAAFAGLLARSGSGGGSCSAAGGCSGGSGGDGGGGCGGGCGG